MVHHDFHVSNIQNIRKSSPSNKRPRLRRAVQLNWFVKMLDSPHYTEIERMQFCFSVKIIYVLSHYYIDVYELQLLRQILETRIKSRMLFIRFLKDT